MRQASHAPHVCPPVRSPSSLVRALLPRLAAVRSFNAKVSSTVRTQSRVAPPRRLFKGAAPFHHVCTPPQDAISAVAAVPRLHSLPRPCNCPGTTPLDLLAPTRAPIAPAAPPLRRSASSSGHPQLCRCTPSPPAFPPQISAQTKLG
jgi:hypothetical protein